MLLFMNFQIYSFTKNTEKIVKNIIMFWLRSQILIVYLQ